MSHLGMQESTGTMEQRYRIGKNQGELQRAVVWYIELDPVVSKKHKVLVDHDAQLFGQVEEAE
jgi:hypothetical protein